MMSTPIDSNEVGNSGRGLPADRRAGRPHHARRSFVVLTLDRGHRRRQEGGLFGLVGRARGARSAAWRDAGPAVRRAEVAGAQATRRGAWRLGGARLTLPSHERAAIKEAERKKQIEDEARRRMEKAQADREKAEADRERFRAAQAKRRGRRVRAGAAAAAAATHPLPAGRCASSPLPSRRSRQTTPSPPQQSPPIRR